MNKSFKKTLYSLIAFLTLTIGISMFRGFPARAISFPITRENQSLFSPSHKPFMVSQLLFPTNLYLPIIIKQPYPTKSYYMHITSPDFDPFTLGQTNAQEHQPIIQLISQWSTQNRLIIILDWGQPCKTPTNAWGAYSFDNFNCHATSELEVKMKDYIGGYCTKMQSIRAGSAGQNCGYRYNQQAVPIIIGFGTNNYKGSVSNAVTFEHGQAWGALINDLTSFTIDRGYAYQVYVAGAMDIEGQWNEYTNTKAWMDGYKNITYNTLYNFGNCDCPDGYQPFAPFHLDWNYDRIHDVSWYRGLPMRYPLPEIYHIDGIDARRWQGLSMWAVINGYGKMTFRELFTQSGACFQTQSCSDGTSNTPLNAITQMQLALDADPLTAYSLDDYLRSTDINWYPRP